MNKYDIMFDATKALYIELFSFYIKAKFYRRKLKKNKFKGIKADLELARLYDDIFPYIKNIAHFGYENFKDFDEIDIDERTDYLRMNKISSLSFFGNYYECINRYIKLLLFLAIHDRDGVSFDLNSRSIILRLMNEIEIESYVLDFYRGFSDESKVIFTKIMQPNFDFRNLTESELDLLNSYHDRYMEEYIYPYVTKRNNSKERILREAISFVKKN